nr:putative zinc finger, CCHC-type [Tanacetum cinerariifolium]
MDLDRELHIDPPAALTAESTADQDRAYEQWERSNQEERLKVEKPDVFHVATTNSSKRKGSWKGKGSSGDNSTPNKVQKMDAECINGKMTKGNKKGVTRSIELLELIHTNICGPFPSGIGGHKSFITFIDDYSRYMYMFLINEKSESLEMFFKAEVENQLDRKIKVVRSNRGGEYYGRHMDGCQDLGSFFDFCKDHGIINQYTMSGTPQQNGIAERRNCTLMDMVHSMLANSKLLGFLWTKALKMAVLILNRTRHAEFLENANNNGSGSFRRTELQEAWDETPIIHVPIPIKAPFDTSNDYLIAQDRLNNVEENEPTLKLMLNHKKLNSRCAGKCNYLESFEDAITCDQSAHLRKATENELNSMSKNNVWDFLNYQRVQNPLDANGSLRLNLTQMKIMSNTKLVWLQKVSPVIKGDVFGSQQCPKTEVEYEEMKRIPYAFVVGCLTYAQVCTRPDIAYICGMLGRFQSNPGLLHWKATKKVLRYLQGTKEYKLTYTRFVNLEVIGYSYSDFVKCKDTSRSTSGYIFMLSGGPISWKSKKQVLTTTSTMMVEYVLVYNVTCHAMLLRNLITGLKIINSISRPLKIYYDNSAAVSFSNSNSSTRAALYLDKKYLFVCERVEEQHISIEHIRTHEMLADPLTKGLPPKVFQGHVAKMGFRQDLT